MNHYKTLGNRTMVYRNSEFIALIDTDDLDKIKNYRWHRMNHGYARTIPWCPAKKKTISILMHKLIVPGVQIDHINRVKSDNRRCNLRGATRHENARNRSKWSKKELPLGISKTPSGVFRARIRVQGKLINIGRFKTEAEALAARIVAEKFHFGEFAPVR